MKAETSSDIKKIKEEKSVSRLLIYIRNCEILQLQYHEFYK